MLFLPHHSGMDTEAGILCGPVMWDLKIITGQVLANRLSISMPLKHIFLGVCFYADKVSKFGNVPWVERQLNIDSEELYAERHAKGSNGESAN